MAASVESSPGRSVPSASSLRPDLGEQLHLGVRRLQERAGDPVPRGLPGGQRLGGAQRGVAAVLELAELQLGVGERQQGVGVVRPRVEHVLEIVHRVLEERLPGLPAGLEQREAALGPEQAGVGVVGVRLQDRVGGEQGLVDPPLAHQVFGPREVGGDSAAARGGVGSGLRGPWVGDRVGALLRARAEYGQQHDGKGRSHHVRIDRRGTVKVSGSEGSGRARTGDRRNGLFADGPKAARGLSGLGSVPPESRPRP